MYRFVKTVGGPFYKLVYRAKGVNKHNVPKEGGVILCANHSSNHDVVVLALTCPRNLRFLAKKELWGSKISSWFFNGMGGIPVDRDNPGMDSFRRSIEVLKNGEPLAVFLQGTRRQEIDTQDFKSGVALFALKAKVPVVPVHITTGYKAFKRVTITFGEPISFEEYYDTKVRAEQLNEIAQRVMDEIAKLAVNEG